MSPVNWFCEVSNRARGVDVYTVLREGCVNARRLLGDPSTELMPALSAGERLSREISFPVTDAMKWLVCQAQVDQCLAIVDTIPVVLDTHHPERGRLKAHVVASYQRPRFSGNTVISYKFSLNVGTGKAAACSLILFQEAGSSG